MAVDYESLNLDVHLQLLSGQPIYVEGVGQIKPLTLKEIVAFGYNNFLEYLNFFTLEIEDFIKEEYLDEINVPLFNIMIAFADDEFQNYLQKAFELFTGKSVVISKEELTVYGIDDDSDLKITSENYPTLRNVIKWQNGILQKSDKKDLKFKNDRAKKIYERLNKTKETVDKLKKKEEGDLDIADIISAISSKSFSLNKLNIFDLTLYQLYDEFKRLDLIENYHTSIKAVMAGAKNVEVNHWTTNIKD